MALAGGGEGRVGDGGADRGHTWLAHAGGGLGRGDDMDLDLWHVVDAQDLVAVEVRLFDLAVLQRDRAVERRAQAEADAPSIWAAMTSGLTATPQSTAQTTRSTLTLPSAPTVTSVTWAT